jgi:hypothetical protein
LASLEDGVGPAHRRSDGDCVESGEPNTNEFRAGIVVAASVLPGELHRANSDNAEAFGRHHSLFGPFVLNRQKAALRFGGTFAPRSEFAVFLGNQIFKILAIPWIADFAIGRGVTGNIAPSEY